MQSHKQVLCYIVDNMYIILWQPADLKINNKASVSVMELNLLVTVIVSVSSKRER